jgi:hypothetical protein
LDWFLTTKALSTKQSPGIYKKLPTEYPEIVPELPACPVLEGTSEGNFSPDFTALHQLSLLIKYK